MRGYFSVVLGPLVYGHLLPQPQDTCTHALVGSLSLSGHLFCVLSRGHPTWIFLSYSWALSECGYRLWASLRTDGSCYLLVVSSWPWPLWRNLPRRRSGEGQSINHWVVPAALRDPQPTRRQICGNAQKHHQTCPESSTHCICPELTFDHLPSREGDRAVLGQFRGCGDRSHPDWHFKGSKADGKQF